MSIKNIRAGLFRGFPENDNEMRVPGFKDSMGRGKNGETAESHFGKVYSLQHLVRQHASATLTLAHFKLIKPLNFFSKELGRKTGKAFHEDDFRLLKVLSIQKHLKRLVEQGRVLIENNYYCKVK